MTTPARFRALLVFFLVASLAWGAVSTWTLEADLGHAITADQLAFRSSAVAGRAAFAGLAAGVIVAAILMAAASAWGLARRLAEYR